MKRLDIFDDCNFRDNPTVQKILAKEGTHQ